MYQIQSPAHVCLVAALFGRDARLHCYAGHLKKRDRDAKHSTAIQLLSWLSTRFWFAWQARIFSTLLVIINALYWEGKLTNWEKPLYFAVGLSWVRRFCWAASRRVVWLPSSIFSSFCPLPAIHVQNPNSGQKIKVFRGRKQVEKKPNKSVVVDIASARICKTWWNLPGTKTSITGQMSYGRKGTNGSMVGPCWTAFGQPSFWSWHIYLSSKSGGRVSCKTGLRTT